MRAYKLNYKRQMCYVGEVSGKCDSKGLYAILIREEKEEKGMYGKTNDFLDRLNGPQWD